jgi:hypothetical protein
MSRVRYVAGQSDDGISLCQRGQLPARLFQRLRSACVDQEIPAAPGQFARQRQAKTPRGPSYQGR